MLHLCVFGLRLIYKAGLCNCEVCLQLGAALPACIVEAVGLGGVCRCADLAFTSKTFKAGTSAS